MRGASFQEVFWVTGKVIFAVALWTVIFGLVAVLPLFGLLFLLGIVGQGQEFLASVRTDPLRTLGPLALILAGVLFAAWRFGPRKKSLARAEK